MSSSHSFTSNAPIHTYINAYIRIRYQKQHEHNDASTVHACWCSLLQIRFLSFLIRYPPPTSIFVFVFDTNTKETENVQLSECSSWYRDGDDGGFLSFIFLDYPLPPPYQQSLLRTAHVCACVRVCTRTGLHVCVGIRVGLCVYARTPRSTPSIHNDVRSLHTKIAPLTLRYQPFLLCVDSVFLSLRFSFSFVRVPHSRKNLFGTHIHTFVLYTRFSLHFMKRSR